MKLNNAIPSTLIIKVRESFELKEVEECLYV